MSETTTGKETKKKPLKLNRPSTLQLRKTVSITAPTAGE